MENQAHNTFAFIWIITFHLKIKLQVKFIKVWFYSIEQKSKRFVRFIIICWSESDLIVTHKTWIRDECSPKRKAFDCIVQMECSEWSQRRPFKCLKFSFMAVTNPSNPSSTLVNCVPKQSIFENSHSGTKTLKVYSKYITEI